MKTIKIATAFFLFIAINVSISVCAKVVTIFNRTANVNIFNHTDSPLTCHVIYNDGFQSKIQIARHHGRSIGNAQDIVSLKVGTLFSSVNLTERLDAVKNRPNDVIAFAVSSKRSGLKKIWMIDMSLE